MTVKKINGRKFHKEILNPRKSILNDRMNFLLLPKLPLTDNIYHYSQNS